MYTHPYVHEKLRELEAELASRALRQHQPSPHITLRPLVRGAGRTLRWLGEGLESWATPSRERTELPSRRRGEPA
ncbi:MAG TPA: hypothetical protein VFT91_05145 [Dehalococcoidia bacterium]|nr:hypothetical protein [Dehalococcoidia bacterium]